MARSRQPAGLEPSTHALRAPTPVPARQHDRNPEGDSARKESAVNNIVRAAAVQISPVLYSRQGTVEKIAEKIRELGKQDVQFAAFPEAVVPYYPYFSFVQPAFAIDRKSTRLNSSHANISYAVFCLKKKNKTDQKIKRIQR